MRVHSWKGSSKAQRVGSLVCPARRHAPSLTPEAVCARSPFASAETSAADDIEDDVEYGDDDLQRRPVSVRWEKQEGGDVPLRSLR